ncbi:MAG TPA: S41 family peptidase [Bacteroidia bacterium]|nr:S41 family peptidase [Bacteroidia bacterium]
MNRPKFYIYLPIVFSLVLVLGILIGRNINLNGRYAGVMAIDSKNQYKKIEDILRYIDEQYVDTINNKQLVEKTITSMLQNLDPHSSYLTAEEARANSEPLQGNFEGIGIEFNIVEDTIRVLSAIPGGPSERVGIQAGDKIVEVEGKKVAGIKITNREVLAKLKGPGDTKVKVGILRRGKSKIQNFTITRGTIPIYSVDVSYMITPKTGYIKISRFAMDTYSEYMKAFDKLQSQGMQQLIIDLRGNGGGFLNTAVSLADEFLVKGKEIVYTIGKARPRTDYRATDKGHFENGKLVILIDDGSASASEILAGAMQDNDRATIIGRRSFGKGLVQEETRFMDSSAIRLTIARYYTPTGRCIQKTYSNGVEDYYKEESSRYLSGELESLDSIKINDSLKYTTPGGKIVYGGGGIIPDVFVPLDTTGRSHYLAEVAYNGLINDFAFDFADRQRSKLKESYASIANFNSAFTITPEIVNEFVAFAQRNGVKPNENQLKVSESIIKLQLKALIARNIWGNDGFYPVLQKDDNIIKKALEILQ